MDGPDVALLPSLAPDEYMIMRDDGCHLGNKSDFQMILSPASLLVTNRQIVVSSQPSSFVLDISTLLSCVEETIHDYHVCSLHVKDADPVHVFLPIDANQAAFVAVLNSSWLPTLTVNPAATPFPSMSGGFSFGRAISPNSIKLSTRI
jgi:hypothetical protein